jgi:hypothetical protein
MEVGEPYARKVLPRASCADKRNVAQETTLKNDENEPQLPFIPPLDKPRKHASPVTDEAKKAIVWLRSLGHIQSDIAAMLGLNQGRVSEVLTGKR